MPIHKSIGRAAAAGVVVSLPATIVAALASGSVTPTRLGCIDVAVWASIAPRRKQVLHGLVRASRSASPPRI